MMVLTSCVAAELKMPPPVKGELLPLMVLLLILRRVPPWAKMPPPLKVETLPLTVLLVKVTSPSKMGIPGL